MQYHQQILHQRAASGSYRPEQANNHQKTTERRELSSEAAKFDLLNSKNSQASMCGASIASEFVCGHLK